jgi:hypothetical protein
MHLRGNGSDVLLQVRSDVLGDGLIRSEGQQQWGMGWPVEVDIDKHWVFLEAWNRTDCTLYAKG